MKTLADSSGALSESTLRGEIVQVDRCRQVERACRCRRQKSPCTTPGLRSVPAALMGMLSACQRVRELGYRAPLVTARSLDTPVRVYRMISTDAAAPGGAGACGCRAAQRALQTCALNFSPGDDSPLCAGTCSASGGERR